MSNQMNPWLAEIYGTDGAEDIEKTAQAALLQKLAADENIDLAQFSPEELQELLSEVLGPEAAQQALGAVPGAAMNQPQAQQIQQGLPQQAPAQQMGGIPQARPQAFAPAAQAQPQQAAPQMQGFQMAQQQAPAQDPAAMQKEAAAKFEEADLLGRVMAHAYTQELEKIAASKVPGPAGLGRKMQMGALKAKIKGRAAVSAGADKAKGFAGKAADHVKKNKGAYGAGAAAAGGFAAGRMSKEASAFEKLAEMQAAEILSQTGYDPATGVDTLSQPDQSQGQQEQAYQTQPYIDQQAQFAQQQQGQPVQQAAGQEQAPVDQEQFQEALDNRSLEMLAAAGYDVNEILARLQLANQQDPGQA